MIVEFREEVYQSFEQRADAGMDLIDAMTAAVVVESPVAMSESPLFRRGFSMIFDTLNEGGLNVGTLRGILDRFQPADAETLADYEIYALDCTDNPAAQAATLEDRGQSKKGRQAPLAIGHRYSWLVRLVSRGNSWAMPQDIERVPTTSSDSVVGGEQVAALAARNDRLKVVVADSLYGNVTFLAFFVGMMTLFALVRLRSNRVLYEEPEPADQKAKGRKRKHGAKFKLTAPREADRVEEAEILGQRVQLSAWHGLHFYQLPLLVGMVLKVEFLKEDGSPRFARPLYLFWTGPLTVSLKELAEMYLWRFAIEHLFRFLKQHLGLNAINSPQLTARLNWMWFCSLAYCQLLLIRSEVVDQRPAWHPRYKAGEPRPMTPRQVQRQALPFLLELGTPATAPQPAGKGRGRAAGYQPAPRKRHPVVRKNKRQRKAA